MRTTLKRRALQEHITRRNLTQNAFAQRIGVSSGYMAQLLRGTRDPSPNVRERLITETKLDFDSLFALPAEEV